MRSIVFIIILALWSSAGLKAQNAENQLPLVGTKAPAFTAKDHEGKIYTSEDLLKENYVVLIFYRGEWCPYCNFYLKNVQDSLDQIFKKKAVVVAVSPEKPEKIEKTINKTGAQFILLHDENYKIMKDFNVAFRPTDEVVKMYDDKLKAGLADNCSGKEILLPIPATFIINQSGIVIYKHVNPDYKVRATVKEILDVLP